MKNWRSIFLIVGIILFSVTAVCLLALFVVWVFSNASPNVISAIVAGFAAILAAIYTQRQLRIRAIEDAHRKSKIEVYDYFMDIIDHHQKLTLSGEIEHMTPEQLMEGIEDTYLHFRRGLLIWASPNVINQFEKFRLSDSRNILTNADSVFAAIRKDLGNSNLGLTPGSFIKLFLKDPREWDSSQQES